MKAVLLLLTGLGLLAPMTAHAQEPNSEEYAVWGATIDSLFANPQLHVLVLDTAQITWRPASGSADSVFRAKAAAAGFAQSAVEDFVQNERRLGNWAIEYNQFDNQRSMEEVERSSAEATLRDAGGMTDPRTDAVILTLSRVGYGSDGQTAVLLVGMHCGTRCDEGKLVQLARGDDGHWHVSRVASVW